MEPNVLDIRDESWINSSGTEAGKIVKWFAKQRQRILSGRMK